MKKILLSCMMALSIGASAQILVNESFESSSLPTGWSSSALPSTATQTPTLSMWSGGTACVGSKMAYRNLYSSVTAFSLIYSSTNSNGSAMDYSFQYAAKGYLSTSPIKGSVMAEYSVDGGTTWNQLGTTIDLDNPGGSPVPCTTISGTIPAGTVPTGADFKFRLTGSYGSPSDFYLGFDDVKLTQAVTAPPGCTTLATPAAGATGVSKTPTLTWNSAAGATEYLINVGTTPGGTDVLNGVNVGNATSYAIPAANALDYSTVYYVKIIPVNSMGNNTGCAESSFTTLNIICPSVLTPTSGAPGVSLTPTITWSALTGATGYKISMGTTAGGTDVLNDQDVGNVTSYTLVNPLTESTKYYYTVNAYNATSTSSSCTERNFTTICGATNVPYLENFESVTTPALPACSSIENAGSGNNWTTYSVGGGFNSKVLNYTYNSSNAANAWFYTQGINLTAGTSYRIKYIYGNASGTTYPEKLKVAYGTSPSSTAMNTILADYPNVTNGTTPVSEAIDFTPSASGVYYFGFNAYSDADMNRLYVDNISIDVTPTCFEPTALVVSNVTASGADLAWTAPTPAPAGGYEYYYSTNNVAPTAATNASGTSTTTSTPLSGLAPATVYYVWVRSVCSASDKSIWSQSATFATACIAVPQLAEGFDSVTEGNLPPCWTSIGSATGNAKAMAYTSAGSGATVSAPNALYLYTSGSSTGIVSTPELTGLQSGNYIISFKARANYTAGGIVEIGYLTDPADTSTFVVLGTYTSTATNSADDYSLNITGVPAGVNKLVLKHTGSPSNSVLIDDFTYMLDPNLSTAEVAGAKNELKVYPNPFTDILNISDVSKVKSVSVVDPVGRIVKTIDTPSSVLHLGDLKQGMYLVTLNMKDGSKQVIKVLKK